MKPLRQFLFALLLVLLPLLWGCGGTDDAPPRARQGVMDLSAWNFDVNGPVDLNGEWEFYWQQLLSPEEFRSEDLPSDGLFLSFPSSWRHLKPQGKSLSRRGYATFRLKVLVGTPGRELALHLGNIRSAYRIWVDNKLLVENGTVGRTVAEEVPGQSVKQVKFLP